MKTSDEKHTLTVQVLKSRFNDGQNLESS